MEFSIECNDCDCVYVGETGRTHEDRCKICEGHIRLFESEMSAVADQALMCDHSTNWKSANVLDTAGAMVKRRINEKLHTGRLSRQKPLIN